MHAYMHTGMTDPLRQMLYVLPQMLSHANACMHALARHPPNGKLTALVLVVVLLPPLNREPRMPCNSPDLQALLTHSMAESSENVVSPGLSVDRGCGSPDSVDDEVFIENSVGLAILETANCTGPDDHTLVGTRRYSVGVMFVASSSRQQQPPFSLLRCCIIALLVASANTAASVANMDSATTTTTTADSAGTGSDNNEKADDPADVAGPIVKVEEIKVSTWPTAGGRGSYLLVSAPLACRTVPLCLL